MHGALNRREADAEDFDIEVLPPQTSSRPSRAHGRETSSQTLQCLTPGITRGLAVS